MMASPPTWLVDMLAAVGLEEVAAAAVATVAGVAGVWLFVKRVWPIVRAIPSSVVTFARGVVTTAQVLESVKGLPDFIDRTDASIAAIHHELHPNSGTSMNDAVRRTEEKVAALSETSERLEEGVAGLYKRVDDLAAVDDRLWATIEPDGEEEDG